MTSQFGEITSLSIFFWHCFVFLIKFIYWFKFHPSIITCSGVMTIYFYKELTRNVEIGNTPIWLLPNIWRLGWVRYTKFGTDVSNKMFLNAAKSQGYSLYHFWIIKGKPTEAGDRIIPTPSPSPHSPIQIRVKIVSETFNEFSQKSVFLWSFQVT